MSQRHRAFALASKSTEHAYTEHTSCMSTSVLGYSASAAKLVTTITSNAPRLASRAGLVGCTCSVSALSSPNTSYCDHQTHL